MNKHVKAAESAITYLEQKGRSVSGLAISKDGFKLEFEKTSEDVSPVDLVNMSEK